MVKEAKKKRGPGRPKKVGLDPSDAPKKNVALDPEQEKVVEDNNLIARENRQLKGMRDICLYVGFSESTVLAWIRERMFPAKKTSDAGIWVSTTNKVDQWREIHLH